MSYVHIDFLVTSRIKKVVNTIYKVLQIIAILNKKISNSYCTYDYTTQTKQVYFTLAV